MAQPAKIFISSANEPALRETRKKFAEEIKMLGHEPLIYELTFGPWEGDPVEHCLNKVEESDIFILLINRSAGRIDPETGYSITHLEYHRALRENKIILVFAESSIKKIFFDDIYPLLRDKLHSDEDYKLDKLKTAVDEVIQSYPYKDRIIGIDSYIWVFLYEIAQHNQIEDIILGDLPFEKIKIYLSDFLRQGSFYLPIKSTIEQAIQSSQVLEKFQNFTFNILKYIENGTVKNWNVFLALLKEHLDGGVIKHNEGSPLEEVIGRFDKCQAITLYKRQGDFMKLIDGTGVYDSTNDQLPLDVHQYYVVKTYLTNERLFFNPDKKMLYFTQRIKQDYVMCFHYPLLDSLSYNTVRSYTDNIIRGIMKTGGALELQFVLRLLGGLL